MVLEFFKKIVKKEHDEFIFLELFLRYLDIAIFI